jgi:hypothetical protein
MKLLYCGILIAILFCLLQCASILGIKNIEQLDDKEILMSANEMKLAENDKIFKFNTELFRKHFEKTKQDSSTTYKDLLQPLQVKAFDYQQNIILYLVNCYVGGLPKLKWNRLGTFDKYPFEQGRFYMPDSGRSVTQMLDLLVPVKGDVPSINELSKNDISIFVYWAKFMGRHSRELINLVKSYQAKYSDRKIEIYYINVDNLLNYE